MASFLAVGAGLATGIGSLLGSNRKNKAIRAAADKFEKRQRNSAIATFFAGKSNIESLNSDLAGSGISIDSNQIAQALEDERSGNLGSNFKEIEMERDRILAGQTSGFSNFIGAAVGGFSTGLSTQTTINQLSKVEDIADIIAKGEAARNALAEELE